MKKQIAVIAVLCAVTSFAVAGGNKEKPAAEASGVSGTFTFGGSTTVAPIAYKAIESFQKANPNAKISYESVGSSTGIKQLLAGVYSLAGSSREVKDSEKETGAVPVAIALDGLSVVANKSVSVSNLTMDQLGKIYTGEISNWKDVGGADEAIVVINRDETSGTYGAFWELVCEKTYGKEVKFRKDALVAKENGEVAAKVASTPGSIGYIGMAFIAQVTQAGGKDLFIDGIEPTIDNVLNKSYKLSRYLYLVTKGEPVAGSAEKQFIDFVLSSKGQAIVKSVEYIPLK
ncbi:MAG TPA: phosphate ABC transporter substrate-binding protein [Treponemataceae bacterium]|nr:phosphate ABC transporter substrate-binding protein [Treponemataceae bacterium]